MSADQYDSAAHSTATSHKKVLAVTYSDSNLELKHSSYSPHLSSSRSDGELVTKCSQCKDCYSHRGTSKVLNHTKSNLKSDACADCSTLDPVLGCSESHSKSKSEAAENIKSLYYSTTAPCTDSIISCADSTMELSNSVTSSTTTVILEANEESRCGLGKEASVCVQDSQHRVSLGEEDGKLLQEPKDEDARALTEDQSEGQGVTLSEKDTECSVLEANDEHSEKRAENQSEGQGMSFIGDSANGTSTHEDTRERAEHRSERETENTTASENDNAESQCNVYTVPECSPSNCTLKPSSSQLLTKYMDIDGLTLVVDVVQERLRQIECFHQLHVNSLHNQLLEERRRRQVCDHGDVGSPSKTNDLADEVVWFLLLFFLFPFALPFLFPFLFLSSSSFSFSSCSCRSQPPPLPLPLPLPLPPSFSCSNNIPPV